jgi:hypothetical protein
MKFLNGIQQETKKDLLCYSLKAYAQIAIKGAFILLSMNLSPLLNVQTAMVQVFFLLERTLIRLRMGRNND